MDVLLGNTSHAALLATYCSFTAKGKSLKQAQLALKSQACTYQDVLLEDTLEAFEISREALHLLSKS